MTGPIPPSTAPAAVPAVGNQPLTEGSAVPGQSRAPGQPVSAVVLSITRNGSLIEVAGQRFLMRGAPPLPAGASLSLELAGTGRPTGSGRLLAIGGQALELPVAIRLQPAPAPTGGREAAPNPPAAAGVQVEARLLGADGRPASPPIQVRLAVAPVPGHEPAATRAAANGDPPTLSGGPLTVEVEGPDHSGHLLLRAGPLTFRLEGAIDVPMGARLQLLLAEGLPLASGDASPEAREDALQRLIGALLRQATATGASAGPSGLRLPAPDHALAAHMLHWIETLDASAGSPDAKTSADTGGPDPGPEAVALRSALHELGQQARAPQADGWRLLAMPLGVENPSPLRLYLREVLQDGEGKARPGRERRKAAQRAVFEIKFSELGRCQLDVLCQARRLDLAVRTDGPLAAGLQDDIRALVGAACEIAGLAGTVEFRAAGLLTLPHPSGAVGRTYMA
jgi:hypothetical protein